MPYSDGATFLEETTTVFVPLAGTPAGGVKAYIPVTARGRLKEVGWSANTLVTSTMTLAIGIANPAVTSTFTQVVTSTLGSFSSTNTFEGAIASVVPPSPLYVSAGDSIQFTFSGGQSSTVGATAYAVIRRA